MKASAASVLDAIDYAERSVRSRIGAGRPLVESFYVPRMTVRFERTGLSSTTAERLALRIAKTLREHVNEATPIDQRLFMVSASFVAVRQLLPLWLNDQTGEHYVYTLRSNVGALLYVGVSSRGPQRLTEHHRDKQWWPLVARVDFERFETRDEALTRERELIRTGQPLFNIQHNTGRQSA